MVGLWAQPTINMTGGCVPLRIYYWIITSIGRLPLQLLGYSDETCLVEECGNLSGMVYHILLNSLGHGYLCIVCVGSIGYGNNLIEASFATHYSPMPIPLIMNIFRDIKGSVIIRTMSACSSDLLFRLMCMMVPNLNLTLPTSIN
ncbi:hypothetical protein Bpfe_003466 [Biomphalaria pfeifferi]|uniref:Uncharacterized protein n=1 Tax=Biomphalaria pfeifferi TaxID=112525 RepID=A0AAD8FKK3_BIOPF|nr:hypothetical protein Bpfe_003466 [Biomphalaria pfeifferi]